MKPKVLIVDDDALIAQQLFWALCDEFETLTAGNLSTALRRATVHEPDVVILDLHLPPTPDSTATGLRILDYVKCHLPSSKVFVATTDPSAEARRECVRRGADGFLSKLPEFEALLETVRRAARARRLAAA